MRIPGTKLLVSFLLSIMLTADTNAQTSISGSVRDAESAALPYATVLLLHLPDSTLVKGAISTENGLFGFDKVKQGNYCVAATMVGYVRTYSPVFTIRENESTLNLGSLVMISDSKQLETVTILGHKPLFEQLTDRLVIHVQNSITAAGGTALDVLDLAPGVGLDRAENTLSLNGKTSVLVMINGKLNRMPVEALLQQLAGMPTASIEKVELITNPPAKYDAEGDAGLINIVLKRNEADGVNGTYSLSVGYGYYEKTAASGMINFRARKLALYSDYSYNNEHMWQLWQFDWNLQRSESAGNTQTNTLAIRRAVMPIHTARGGFEYNLSPRVQLAGLVSGFDSRWAMNALSNVRFQYQSEEVNGKVITKEVNHWQHLLGNLGLRFQGERNEFTIDIDRLYYNNIQPTRYENQYQKSAQGESTLPGLMSIDKRTPFKLTVAKADLTRTLHNNWKFETGIKGSYLSLRNRVVTEHFKMTGWKNDSIHSQSTKMTEYILAGYMNLKGNLPGKWQFQGGLRGEATRTFLLTNNNMGLVDRRYISLFPSAFLTHEISKHSSLQLSYSRRITRPPYKVLAPTMIFIGPTTLRTGNPSILPTLSNAFQLNYRFKDSYLLTVRYSLDRNQFFDYQPQIDRSDPQVTIQVFNTRNIDRSHSIATTFVLPWQPTQWWQSQTQILGVWQHSKTLYENSTMKFGQLYGQVNTTHTFRLWQKASAELTAFYNTPSQTMGIFKRQAYGSVTIGVQQKVNHQKGVVRLTVSDLLWTNKRIGHYNVPSQNMSSYTAVIYEPRVFKLSYSHNFGRQAVKSSNKRKTGSEEERERAN